MERFEEKCVENELYDTYKWSEGRKGKETENKRAFKRVFEFLLYHFDGFEDVIREEMADELKQAELDYYKDSDDIAEIEEEEYYDNVIKPQIDSWR